MIYKESIGLVGGFGGFATLDFFRRLLNAFNTGWEREYPHILMDNDFTMPSRTKSLLYGDDLDQVKEMIAASNQRLIEAGADYIIWVCNTAHLFLQDVYDRVPGSEYRILDIVDKMGKRLQEENVKKCFIMAAEASLKWHLFDDKFAPYGIQVYSPSEADWSVIRNEFVEAVKQDKVTEEVKKHFIQFIRDRSSEVKGCDEKIHVVLGCTELPLLADEYDGDDIVFHDPLENILDWLKKKLR